MAKRKSFNEGFKVAETVGKSAEGEDSLLALNNQIMAATDPGDIFIPMRRLCVACAAKRKLISKVRGDSDDFLNYATLQYVQRWQKQFGKYDARRPVQAIQNWIPYISGTIRFSLMSFNKEVYDYDILPLPTLLDDTEDNTGDYRDILDTRSRDPVLSLSMEAFAEPKALHSVLLQLPEELQPYLVDILFYVKTAGQYSQSTLNFVKIGRNIFMEKAEEWVMT